MKNEILKKARKLKAFTLIEMLIVIVIIGILAAALIPRLSSARGRANDTARKAILSQVAAALVSHQIDKGYFPGTCGDLELASVWLLVAWLDSIPLDPANSMVNYFSGAMTAWQYGYCAIEKNGQANGGFVLAAVSETEGWANYVQCGTSLMWERTFSDIQSDKCTSFSIVADCAAGSDPCDYQEWEWQLRYIYVQ